jgi:hypothetical protein
MSDVVVFPLNAWDLEDSVIIAVGVGPADPRDKARLNVEGKNPGRQWDSPEDLDHRQAHQAEVPALIETPVRRHNLVELTTAFVEMINGHDTVEQGNDTSYERPQIEKRYGRIHQHDIGVGSKVFYEVEAVPRDNVLAHHLEAWNAHTNKQINNDSTALLRRSDHHRCGGCNLIKATIDTKRASRDGDIQRGLDAEHNITVDGGLDDHVVVPQDGIDALHKAANTDPSHVHASASVPSLQMPIERDGAENETNKGKSSVKVATHLAD